MPEYLSSDPTLKTEDFSKKLVAVVKCERDFLKRSPGQKTLER